MSDDKKIFREGQKDIQKKLTSSCSLW